METVTIDGVEYVRASVLAKAHKYTADYIGQLCRANKVDAHLVRRTWYVYPPSLEGHKSSRYAEARSTDKSFKIKPVEDSSRRNVPTPPSKTTVRSQESNFGQRVFWRSPVYDEDESDLLPKLRHDGVLGKSVAMKIDLAESKRVSIAGRSDNVTMVSVPPPAIALAGTLKVQSYEPRFNEIEDITNRRDDFENTSYNDESESVLAVKEVLGSRSEEVKILKEEREDLPQTEDSNYVYNVPLKRHSIAHAPLSFTPESIKRRETKILSREHTLKPKVSKVEAVKVPDVAHSLFFNLVVTPAVVLLVVMAASSFFFLESLTQVDSRGEQVRVLNLNASLLTTFFGPHN